MELESRGRWNGDPAILNRLRRAYLQAEGDLEDGVSGEGEMQAGNVEIVTHSQVPGWSGRLADVENEIRKWTK